LWKYTTSVDSVENEIASNGAPIRCTQLTVYPASLGSQGSPHMPAVPTISFPLQRVPAAQQMLCCGDAESDHLVDPKLVTSLVPTRNVIGK
jgi:hypothetical protein